MLAIDVARYEGEPIAAVAAVDEATAEEALELIDVDYGPLAAVMTLEEALATGAPLVHAGQPPAGHFADLATLKPRPGTNICHQFHFARGDTAASLRGADVVVEDAYRFPPVQHVALEAHAVVAAWDETGMLTLWASTQNPYSVRVELAKMFDVPLARIRVVVPHLGGGFGSKTYAKLEPLAATLARAAGPSGAPGRLGAGSVPDGAPLRLLAWPCEPASGATARSWPSNATRTTTSAPTPTSVRASFRRPPTRRRARIASRT